MAKKARTIDPRDQQDTRTPASTPNAATTRTSRARRIRIVGSIGLSAVLFSVSLFLPAYNLSDGDTFPGLSIFLIGWMGIFYLPGGLGWYANIFLLITWVGLASSKFRISLLSTVIGIGLAVCSVLLRTIMVDEGGTMRNIASMGTGFYVWLGSFAVCLAADLAVSGYDLVRGRASQFLSKRFP